jgi:hypothetical protein
MLSKVVAATAVAFASISVVSAESSKGALPEKLKGTALDPEVNFEGTFTPGIAPNNISHRFVLTVSSPRTLP